MLKQRALQVTGWYSTNILGNRDGEVLDHPAHRKLKLTANGRYSVMSWAMMILIIKCIFIIISLVVMKKRRGII